MRGSSIHANTMQKWAKNVKMTMKNMQNTCNCVCCRKYGALNATKAKNFCTKYCKAKKILLIFARLCLNSRK